MNHEEDYRGGAPLAGDSRPLRARRWVMTGIIVASLAAATGGGARLAAAAQMAMEHHGAHIDPATADAHIGEMVDQVLADGTAEQKARLTAIIRSAHAEMARMHAQLGQAHERAYALLMQPQIDRAALEALRVEQVRQLDASSRRLVQSFADAAEMLTPEQRARLFDHMRGHMH